VTTPSLHHASGQEVLVVDRDEKVTRGLEKVLGRLGLVVTATADTIRAQDLLINKFFAVALFDIDTPAPGAGLELLRFARERSPLTTVLIMTTRKAFDIGVAGFRGGAADVVVKEPDAVPYLKDRVVAVANELIATSDRNTLLEEVLELHEEFLRRMRQLSRQTLDLEDRVLGRVGSATAGASDTCTLLVVDDDPEVAKSFEAHFPESAGWRITSAVTGGEGLDFAAELRPQIVLVKDPLPDLPARMVTNNAKRSSADSVTIVYQTEGAGGSGEVTLVEGSRPMSLLSGYSGPAQLVGPLAEVREGIRQKLKERRYLQVFRSTNLEFLHRYNNVRDRVQAVIARAKKTATPS
jgi:DNA-binding response OmpR family regulator